MTTAEVLAEADRSGVFLWVDGGQLRFRSSAPLAPELREVLAQNRAALLVHLGAWDQAEALALMDQADALVERSGTPGTRPDISAAAERCTEAHRLRDMAGVRRECATIEAACRERAAA